MKFLATALVAALFALTAPLASAQDKFGDALVEKGELIIVRQGNNLKFAKAPQPVPVFVQDVLRVGDNSSVVLKTREKSTITMGANAIFQVKPFQYQEKQGFARLLFGRFKSLVQGLQGTESVNAKTATAVIGVKGTENLASIRPRGDTMLVGVESVTTIQNPISKKGKALHDRFWMTHKSTQGGQGIVRAVNRGNDAGIILIPTTGERLQVQRAQNTGDSPVGPDRLGLTLGDSDPIVGDAPPEVLDQLQNLDSPPSNDEGAGEFPGQDGLVRTGLTTEEDLDEGEQEDVEGGEGEDVVGGETETPGDIEEPDLNDPAQNLFRGDVNLQFQQ